MRTESAFSQKVSSAWCGIKRTDGALVIETFTGSWFVLSPDEHPAIDRCPACERELKSQRAAQLVADYVFPLRRGSTDMENSKPDHSDQGTQTGK
jgi:hypothetical protein